MNDLHGAIFFVILFIVCLITEMGLGRANGMCHSGKGLRLLDHVCRSVVLSGGFPRDMQV